MEDPIEVLHPDKQAVVVQREVGVDTADISSAVKAATRQDADVIVISEIDGYETARAAIAAAETGHFVVSSMRTTDPADTLNRLIGYFPIEQQDMVRGQLAGLVKGIVSQRLIETAGGGGQVMAAEVLTTNERTQEWLLAGGSVGALTDVIKESEFFGMQTFDQSILRLVMSRQVNVDTALVYVRNSHELKAKAIEAGLLS